MVIQQSQRKGNNDTVGEELTDKGHNSDALGGELSESRSITETDRTTAKQGKTERRNQNAASRDAAATTAMPLRRSNCSKSSSSRAQGSPKRSWQTYEEVESSEILESEKHKPKRACRF